MKKNTKHILINQQQHEKISFILCADTRIRVSNFCPDRYSTGSRLCSDILTAEQSTYNALPFFAVRKYRFMKSDDAFSHGFAMP